MNRFILSEDKQTATFDDPGRGLVKLKAVAVETTKLAVCDGCYFLQSDDRCADNIHRYSENGTTCSTDRTIIWAEGKE